MCGPPRIVCEVGKTVARSISSFPKTISNVDKTVTDRDMRKTEIRKSLGVARLGMDTACRPRVGKLGLIPTRTGENPGNLLLVDGLTQLDRSTGAQ